jgi:hypothetical protein
MPPIAHDKARDITMVNGGAMVDEFPPALSKALSID